MDATDINQKSAAAGWQAALDAERIRIATTVLPALIGTGVVFSVFFVGIYFAIGRPWQWVWMIVEIAQTPICFSLAYILARRRHLTATVYLTVLAISVTSVVGPALVEGMVLPGVIAGMIAMMFSRLLAGRTENRGVVLISGTVMATGIVLSSLRLFEILPIATWIQVVVAVSGIVIMALVTAFILESRDRRYEDSLAQAEAYATELNAQRATLEQRTGELARRARYLEATARVARDAASVLNVQELLGRVAVLVSEQFGFYHTGIFLLDAAGEWAVLQAASSEGGQRMLARGHRLGVGQEGIVGYVTGRGQPRVALDVGADAVFFDNPDLPDTHSEMALPLQARGEVIGALDVQSTEPRAFSSEDVTVLQTLADQVAMAISNARLFQQAQESLEVERQIYGEFSLQSWRELLRAQSNLGVLKQERGISPAGDVWQPAMETALRTGTTTMGKDGAPSTDGASSTDGAPSTDGTASLATPIKVRGQVIGVVDAHRPDGAGGWTPEQIGLLETLADQLGVALESARLYQEAQRRAARERLTREITDKMRRATSVEGIVQTAVDELFNVLETSRAFVRLGARAGLLTEPAPLAQEDGNVDR